MHRTPAFAFVLCAALSASVEVCAAPDTGATEGKPNSAGAAARFRETKWEELVPKGWDPAASFANQNTNILSDADPRAWRLMRQLRQVLDNAPTVDAMNSATIKIPGYIVPLEQVRGAITEFLLVPYFGACIHVPPPPANQIIYVVPDKPVPGFHAMDTVWVSGTLHTTRFESYAGTSGYTMNAAAVDRFVGPTPY